MSSIRDPQEKKRLAYEHDRRNRFGQNAKASRKIIPLRKKKGERAYRKRANQSVVSASKSSDLLADDAVGTRIANIPKTRWRKVADVSLADAIEMKKNWRVMRFGRKTGKAITGGDLNGWSVNAELNSVDQENILKKPNQRPTPRKRRG